MNYYLAPMMGYTDCYFRSLVENIYGNSVTTFSEMIVDKAIIHNETKTITKHFLKNNKSAIQIAGSDPEEIKRTINILNKVFTPSEEEITKAKKIIDRFNASDTGLVVIDGKLIEKPVLREMQRRILVAEKISK